MLLDPSLGTLGLVPVNTALANVYVFSVETASPPVRNLDFNIKIPFEPTFLNSDKDVSVQLTLTVAWIASTVTRSTSR
jgi:hypothetical protein